MMGDGQRATHTRHERRPHLRRRIPLAARGGNGGSIEVSPRVANAVSKHAGENAQLSFVCGTSQREASAPCL